jgi:hypothetical protein
MAKQKRTSTKSKRQATGKAVNKRVPAAPPREPLLYTFRVGPHPNSYPSEGVRQAGSYTVMAAGDHTLDEVLEEMAEAPLPFDPPEGFRNGFDDLENARTIDSLGLRPGDELLITGMVWWQARVEEVRPLTRPRQIYPLVDLGNFDTGLMEEMSEDEMRELFATDDVLPEEPVYRVMAHIVMLDKAQARQTVQAVSWRERGSPPSASWPPSPRGNAATTPPRNWLGDGPYPRRRSRVCSSSRRRTRINGDRSGCTTCP